MTLLTIEQMEHAKCKQDPVYFIENYVKIKVKGKLSNFFMYGYQKRAIGNFQSYQHNIMLTSRQSGMTESSLAYMLWYAIFHNENKHIIILSPKEDSASKLIDRLGSMLNNLPGFLTPIVVGHSNNSITFPNDSTLIFASTCRCPVIRDDCSILYIDSCAYMPNSDSFFHANSNALHHDSKTRVILQSSANGVSNAFYRLWELSISGKGKFNPQEVSWVNVINLPVGWAEGVIENIGREKFAQEYENKFLQPVKPTQGTREYIEEPSVRLTDNHLIIWWGMADIDNVVLSYDEIKTCFFEPNIMRRQPVEIQDLADPYSREHRNKMRGEVKITTRHDEKACFPDITFQTTKGGYKLLLDKLAPCPYSSTEIGIPVSSDCKSF